MYMHVDRKSPFFRGRSADVAADLGRGPWGGEMVLETVPGCSLGAEQVGLVTGFMGLLMGCYEGLQGILSELTKSTDHPSRGLNR